MYYKRGKMLKKRLLSGALVAGMVMSVLSGIVPDKMSTVHAATMPKNPTVSGGVTTWDLVYFGSYAQSDAKGVAKDPIKWRVLNVNGNDAFLMADSALDVQRFHKDANRKNAEGTLDEVIAPWDKSCIRSWLNGYNGGYNECNIDYSNKNFFKTAFSTVSEQEAVMTTNLAATTNPTFTTSTAGATSDKVFLLTYEDVLNSNYGFSSSYAESSTRKKTYTAYVIGTGGAADSSSITKKEVGKGGYWWLRTPGRYTNMAMLVKDDGSIYNDNGRFKGYDVTYDEGLVCPAIHLDLSKTGVWSYAGTVDSNGKYTAGEAAPVVSDTDKVVTTEGEATYTPATDDAANTEVVYQATDSTSENVVIPSTVTGDNGITYKVTSIAAGTFKNNKKLKSIVIGDNIISIGDSAFYGCTNLQTVVIGKNVKTIGAKAFYKCTKIKKIVIPASVNKIGKQAFFGCKKLKSITIKTTKLTNKKVGAKAFKGTHKKATFKVPKKKLSAYKKLLKSKGASSKAKFKK